MVLGRMGYVIGEHEFKIAPGLMPKRLDVGGLTYISPDSNKREQLKYRWHCEASRFVGIGIVSQNAQKFLKDCVTLVPGETMLQKFIKFYQKFAEGEEIRIEEEKPEIDVFVWPEI